MIDRDAAPTSASPIADCTVVIPTYNERENIAPLLGHILELPRFRALVVDDNSPDGTAEIVAQIAADDSRVERRWCRTTRRQKRPA